MPDAIIPQHFGLGGGELDWFLGGAPDTTADLVAFVEELN